MTVFSRLCFVIVALVRIEFYKILLDEKQEISLLWPNIKKKEKKKLFMPLLISPDKKPDSIPHP